MSELLTVSMPPDGLQNPVSWVPQRLEALRQHAESYYAMHLPRPELLFNIRGRNAGELKISRLHAEARYVIRLNRALLKTHARYFYSDVLPHEMAHLVVECRHGSRVKPHGPEWRAVMTRCFQVEPKVYHSLPTESARRVLREYEYHCGCQAHSLSIIRHRRAIKGVVYSCRKCGGALRRV